MHPLRYDPETNTPLTNLALADLRLLIGQWATESEGALAAIVDRIEQLYADSRAWCRDNAMREGPPPGTPVEPNRSEHVDLRGQRGVSACGPIPPARGGLPIDR